jgi:hypothetical protein
LSLRERIAVAHEHRSNMRRARLATGVEPKTSSGAIARQALLGLTSSIDKQAVKLMLKSDLTGPHGLFNR